MWFIYINEVIILLTLGRLEGVYFVAQMIYPFSRIEVSNYIYKYKEVY